MLSVIKIFDIVKLSLYESRQCYQQFVRLNSSVTVMKVLNVAEKNDAAKNIAGYLSCGTCNRVIEKTLFSLKNMKLYIQVTVSLYVFSFSF